MARKPDGWTLQRDERTGNWMVRFRANGRRYRRSTRTKNREEAQKRAATIFARVVSGRENRQRLTAPPLEDVAAAWLASRSGLISPEHWDTQFKRLQEIIIPFFRTLPRITPSSIEDYTRMRLRQVLVGTLKKELSILRMLMLWCEREGIVEKAPRVDNPHKRALGTPHKNGRRRIVTVTPEMAGKILAELPEESRHGTHPRAYYTVMWETGLRKGTLDSILTPTDYEPGRDSITIRDAADKARFGRELPLTPAAQRALESVCPQDPAEPTLIFGAHDLRYSLKKAAARAGMCARDAQDISNHDFRHAFMTDMAQHADPVTLQYLAGHLNPSTTAKYVHPHASRAAEALSKRAVSGPLSGPRRKPIKKREP